MPVIGSKVQIPVQKLCIYTKLRYRLVSLAESYVITRVEDGGPFEDDLLRARHQMGHSVSSAKYAPF